MKNNKQNIFLAISFIITAMLIGGIWLSSPKEQAEPDDIGTEMFEETEEGLQETSDIAVEEETGPQIDLKQKAKEYEGEWWDLYSTRCNMMIEVVDDDKLSVIVEWGNSAFDTSHWEMTGQIDPKTGRAEYHDCTLRDIHYDENGAEGYETRYVDGSGRIYIGDDGYLYWEDDMEQVGEECYFERYDDSAEATDTADGYILPESDKRYLSTEDLAGLDQAMLRLARNEIYARHGRKFQSEDLNVYFSQQPWYHGYLSEGQFDDSVFNVYEKANLELIKSIESSGTGGGVSDLFDIYTLSGGYEGENVEPYLLMSISIYSSPEPGSDKIGNYTITVPQAGLEDTGELRRDSDKTFSLISNGGGHARIEVVDDTFGAVVIHYVESGFECDLRMYEAYGNP